MKGIATLYCEMLSSVYEEQFNSNATQEYINLVNEVREDVKRIYLKVLPNNDNLLKDADEKFDKHLREVRG